jgi:hypothetical protein
MRFLCAAFVATSLSLSTAAQTAAAPAAPVAAAATTASATPTSMLKPALDGIPTTLGALHPEKWKTSGAIKQETQANITSIQTDLQTTLPPLLTVADAHPESTALVLPVFRNISALYDVLLRVTQVAALAAPAPQSTSLQQTLATFDKSRRDLGESLQTSAQTQNQQVHDLQAQLTTIQNTPPPPPVVCPTAPAPPAPKKRKPKPKPAPATAAPTP